MSGTAPASNSFGSTREVHEASQVFLWLRRAVGWLVFALTCNTYAAYADTLVAYSFNGTSVGQANNFTNNSVAFNITASTPVLRLS